MRFPAVLAAAVVLALAGCSGDPAPTAAPAPSSTSTSTPTTSAAPVSSASERSVRGLRPKALGEEAAFVDDAGQDQAVFSVDAIEVDPPCTGSAVARPERGHFVALSFTVKTTAAFQPSTGWYVAAKDMQVVGPDGATETIETSGPALGCLPEAEQLPLGVYSPSSTYTGRVVIDTRHAAGVVLYRPSVTPGGWEWTYPTT